jgi:glycosyltransferase involved in cell wall biosynthesis
LSSEKGVGFVVEAWKKWGPEAPILEIIGDGPDRAALEHHAAGGNVRFLGQVNFDKAQALMASSRMLILPSVCYEGFPMVIREAFALGVPVAASRVGSLPFIVDEGTNGVLFQPGDPEDLHDRVRGVWSNSGLGRMGEAARAKFDREYTAETNYKSLMRIYHLAMARRRGVQ